MEDGATEGQTLLPSAGEQPGHHGALLDQPGHTQNVGLPIRPPLLGHAVNAAEKIDVLLDGQIIVERELLRHIANV